MTPDQITRLRALTEKLADAFLTEADPSLWSGGEQPVAELTTQARGDRYWCKKNAIATAAVLNATLLLIQRDGTGGGEVDPDHDMDAEVRQAEKDAAAAIKAAKARSNAAAKR
jgi:hypothetical protein